MRRSDARPSSLAKWPVPSKTGPNETLSQEIKRSAEVELGRLGQGDYETENRIRLSPKKDNNRKKLLKKISLLDLTRKRHVIVHSSLKHFLKLDEYLISLQ